MDKCEVCGGQIKVMTPPEKGICSENCKLRKRKARKAHDTSQSPVPQRGVQHYG